MIPHNVADPSPLPCSNILDELPWYTGPPRDRTPTGTSYYSSMLEVVEKRLAALEEKASPDVLMAHLGLDSALIPGRGALQSLFVNTARISKERVSHLASNLLQYRLFDVLRWISSENLRPLDNGKQARSPIPHPAKIFYKKMSNWPSVVQSGLSSLQHAFHFEDQADSPHTWVQHLPSKYDVASSLFTSLSHRLQDIDGHSILSNFECAALYMSIIFQLKDPSEDIPTTTSEFRVFLKTIAMQGDSEVDSFLQRSNTPHTFKLPLHIALGISGVCLFLPTQLMLRDMSRLQLLMIWQGLGGPRPQSLLEVDRKIFRALTDVALGLCLPELRFGQLFRDLRDCSWSSISLSDAEWLRAEGIEPPIAPAPSETLSTPLSLLRQRRESASPYEEGMASNADGSAMENARVSQSTGTPPEGRLVRLVSALTRESPEPEGEGGDGDPYFRPHGVADGEGSAVVGVGVRHDPATSKNSSGQRVTEGRSSAGRGSRRKSGSGISRSKRSSPYPTQNSRAKSAPRYKAPSHVYHAVDLSAERAPLVVDSIDHSSQHELLSRQFDTPSFTAMFHSSDEMEWFTSMWEIGQTFLGCSPSRSNRTLRDGQIVVEGLHRTPPVWPGFNEQGLQAIGSLLRVVPAYDFSRPHHQRETFIRLSSFLDATRASPARIIHSGNLPVTHSPSTPPRSVSSDIIAWDSTINQPWCHGWHEMPRSTMHFASVWTNSAYTKLQVERHGLGLYLEILMGSLWLLIGRPRIFGLGTDEDVECEPLHLTAGSALILKPGTPYLTFATDHTLLRGSYWYASSTLKDTCGSILRDFLHGPGSSSHAKAKDSRTILRRLVHFYHMVYFSGLFFEQRESEECAHTPDVSTIHGMESLFSLANIMELGNVLAGDDYSNGAVSDHERQEMVEARRLCRRMVRWIEQHFMVVDRALQSRISIFEDVWMAYLARHITLIKRYRQSGLESGVVWDQNSSLLATLEATVGENIPLSVRLRSLEGEAITVLEWEAFRSMEVQAISEAQQCDFDDIVGENWADIEYYRRVRLAKGRQ